MKPAFSYKRVSSIQQAADDRMGFQRQDEAIERYAQAEGFTLLGSFSDSVTGTTANREGLEQLRAALKKTPRAAVLIGETRAMARDLTVAFHVLSDLQTLGVPVHSADMGLIDLSDEGSALQFTMRTLMDHTEKGRLSKRTYHAKVAMAEQGRLPHGMSAYGYYTLGGMPLVNDAEAKIVERIFTLAADGRGQRDIARYLNNEGIPPIRSGAWGYTTVGRILRNPAYKGEAVWTRRKGTRRTYTLAVPAIVDPVTWAKAQPRGRGAPPRLGHPLTGFVRCERCGANMHLERDEGRVYWRCSSRQLKGRTGCGSRMVRAEGLTELVEAELRKALSDPATVRRILEASAEENPQHAEELADLDRQDKEALDLWRKGVLTPDEFGAVRAEVAARRLELRAPSEDIDPSPLIEAAKDAPFAELLRMARVTVYLSVEGARLEYLG